MADEGLSSDEQELRQGRRESASALAVGALPFSLRE